MELAWDIFINIAPSIGLGFLFWFVMRAVIRADSRERMWIKQLDEQNKPQTEGNQAQ